MPKIVDIKPNNTKFDDGQESSNSEHDTPSIMSSQGLTPMNRASKADLKMTSLQTTNNSGESYDDQLVKRCKNVHFDVESWYMIIQHETFETEFVPISPSHAQALVHFYQTRYMSKSVLTLEDIHLIHSMEYQLKEQIFQSNNKFPNRSVFIRLSARSPKDGKPLDPEEVHKFYQEKLNDLRVTYPAEYQSSRGKANIQAIALYYAQFHSLKVIDACQALNLILTSERIHYDLIEALDCHEVRKNGIDNVNHRPVFDWNNHLIIRQWNELLDPSMEFRCFVYQSKLTAISQYNYYCKYFHLQSTIVVQQIKTTIKQYWQDKIQPLFAPHPDKYSNYVIDIGLLQSKITNEYECIVVEMNPFERTTNPSLFDWIYDDEQLKGNGIDVEIRVQTDYYPYIEDYIGFLLEINGCHEGSYSPSDQPGKQPYFIFLERMKLQLTL